MIEKQEATVPVNLMGKTFSIKCKMEEAQALEQSIAFLQRRLTTLRNANNEFNLERLLSIASLNLINEMIHGDKNQSNLGVNQQVSDLIEKIENQLTIKPKNKL